MGQKGYQSPAKKVLSWIRKKSKKVKIFLGLITSIILLVTLKLVVHDHNLFFVIAEAIHLIGLLVLIYKLTTLKTCSGNFYFSVYLKKKEIFFLCSFHLIGVCVKLNWKNWIVLCYSVTALCKKK